MRASIAAPAVAPQQSKDRTRTRFDMSLRHLMEHGYLAAGARLLGTHRTVEYRAVLTDKARIRIESGEEFEAASPAAAAALERQSWNGWMFWQVEEADGTLRLLDDLRKVAITETSSGPEEASTNGLTQA
jgi:hypothetical protein